MRGVRIGLLLMAVVGAGLIAPVGFAAETEPSADVVSAESDARFLADFDGNGFRDLAVGAPGEGFGSAGNAGAVHVIYGSANGLTGAGSQFWSQNSPGIFSEAEEDDQFGSSLAVADFDGDGFSDLAIGVPGEDAGSTEDTGGVHVIYGSPSGLTAAGSQFWTQNSLGVFGEAEEFDSFGRSLAAANFGRSTHADLAVGVPDEDAGSAANIGGVHVIYGSANGLTGTGSQFWTQNSPGVFGEAEEFDQFGVSLAAANFGKSAHADLAIGESFEDAGGVHVIYGSPSGLTGTGSQFWTQNSTGIFGEAEADDEFGRSLAAANFGKSSHADLAIGVPSEDAGSTTDTGGVHVIYGSANGLTGTGSQFWTQNSTGIFGEAETGDQFGWSLATANFGKSSHADLAVGVPREDAGSTPDTGGVHVIYGSANGLMGTGSQFWTQNSTGIPGEAETGEEFGFSLAAANFGKSSHADLAVGVPFEEVGSDPEAGGVNVSYGSVNGLTGTGSQFWTQGFSGINGETEQGDLFGLSLAAANS
jgi:hypothetical protein